MKNKRQFSKRFFVDKEYDNLRYKHLPLKEYALFIEIVHKRICEELILGNKEGVELPLGFGRLQILKNLNLNGVKNTITKEVYENTHSMGFAFRCVHSCQGRRIKYNNQFNEDKDSRDNFRKVPFVFYKFNSHRENIKRSLARKIKKGEMNYYTEDKKF